MAIGIIWVRDFLFFVRDQGGETPPLNYETLSYLLRYFAAGGLFGLAIGVLFKRPVVWFAIGVLCALGFACAGDAVAQ